MHKKQKKKRAPFKKVAKVVKKKTPNKAISRTKAKAKKKKASKTSAIKVLKVAELFAGVGGFRIGLERASEGSNAKFSVVWSSQWEPGSKAQHASDIYVEQFFKKRGKSDKEIEKEHSNINIADVDVVNEIPAHDVLVGGFPCQDYSVARTLKQAEGLVGKKGVLWWQIHRILNEKKVKPKYLILENVDRLLKSPADRRGRDFAIMLASLSDLGYAVEWRVINAADYGFPQRRRRIFFIGYHASTSIYKKISRLTDDHREWLLTQGTFAKAFPLEANPNELPLIHTATIKGDLVNVTNEFNLEHPHRTPFFNAGLMFGRTYWTIATHPKYAGHKTTLGDILIKEANVPQEFYLNEKDMQKWHYLKGAKSAIRINRTTGHEYTYDEGPMTFPDPIDSPSRTIVTGEGGSTPSRFKHVVKTSDGRLRRLTPVELERLNMFPDDHTAGASDIKRAFLMGNALVVGIIEKIGKELIKTVQAHGR